MISMAVFREQCTDVKVIILSDSMTNVSSRVLLLELFYFTRFATFTNINTTKPLHNITCFTYNTGRD